MNVTVSPQPKSIVRVNIELTPEEMQPHLERAAENLSKKYKIEGFRPGKASLGIVQQKLGPAVVWEEAAELAVRKSFVEAVRQQELTTVGTPKITVHKLAPDNPFVYHADVALLPDVKLGDYTALKTKKAEEKVSDEKITKALEDLREMFAKEEPAEKAAEKGDKVEVDFTLSVDGVPVENGSSTNHPVVIGSGNFIPGFEDQLVGLKKDDKKEFSLSFPQDYGNKVLAGKTGTFAVTGKGVFTITKPPLDDAFAAQASRYKTLPELRAEVEKNLTSEADQEADQQFERDLIEELIEKSKFGDLPELLIESELNKMIGELKEEVERRGMKYEDYLSNLKKTEADLRKEFQLQAEKRVKSALVLRAIAKAEKIQVNPDEIQAEIQTALETYKNYPELRGQIETDEYRDFVQLMLTNRKVVQLLKDKTQPAK